MPALTNPLGDVSQTGQSKTQLPRELESVRSKSLALLSELVSAMVGRLENDLFEFSKALLNNHEQQAYMDAIIEIRTKADAVNTQFSRSMAAAFMSIGQTSDTTKTDSFDFDSLSLVKTEDMDIAVAIDAMVARARLDYAAALGLLKRRFAHKLPRAAIDDRNFPLDPGVIADAFKTALNQLEIKTNVKISILKSFPAGVLLQLAEVYEESNQILIDSGVLPDLKVGEINGGRTAKTAKAAAEKKAEKAKPKLDTEEMFAFLHDVLQTLPVGAGGGAPNALLGASNGQFHGGQYVGGGGIGGLPATAIGGSVASVPIVPMNIAPTAVVQAVDTEGLVSLLSNLQSLQPKARLVEDDSAPSVSQVRESIRDNLHSDEKSVEAIKQADEDVINLVSMLFDFILDDDDLPTAMKALIGRLQIPLLKVAILDKSFFNAETHSARRLLNLLAKAGIGWNQRDPGGDSLYMRIEEVVFRILNEFIDDLDLFDELLEEFSEFYAQQQKREEAIDKRTRDAEEGRARADLARAMVQQTLNRRLTGRQLPIVAVRILQEAWRNVLYLACLRDGTDSEAWKQAVKVVDALIWSVTPQANAEWLLRLKDVSPKLMNSLKKGLSSANYDALMTESLLRELAQVHVELTTGAELRTVSVLDEVDAAKAEVTRSEGVIDVAAMTADNANQLSAVLLPSAEVNPMLQGQEALPGDDEHVVVVNRLNVGSWVEFVEEDKRDRNKLVARIRSVDKLIFANRRGIKVAEMTGMKLAVDMSIGRARIIEEAEVVDKALESVIGSLRDIKSKQQAAGT